MQQHRPTATASKSSEKRSQAVTDALTDDNDVISNDLSKEESRGKLIPSKLSASKKSKEQTDVKDSKRGAFLKESATAASADSDRRWDEMFGRLCSFQKQFGHCMVPTRYNEDTQLGAWVADQRRNYRIKIYNNSKTTLTPEREARLQQIGFQFVADNANSMLAWQRRFRELLEFVAKNGHAEFPTKSEKHKKLSNWVSAQRQHYKSLQEGQLSTLTDYQIKLLDSIGFVWVAKRGGRRRHWDEDDLTVPNSTTSQDKKSLSPFQQTAQSLLKALDSGYLLSLAESASSKPDSTASLATPAAHSQAESLPLAGLGGSNVALVNEASNRKLMELLLLKQQQGAILDDLALAEATRRQALLTTLLGDGALTNLQPDFHSAASQLHGLPFASQPLPPTSAAHLPLAYHPSRQMLPIDDTTCRKLRAESAKRYLPGMGGVSKQAGTAAENPKPSSNPFSKATLDPGLGKFDSQFLASALAREQLELNDPSRALNSTLSQYLMGDSLLARDRLFSTTTVPIDQFSDRKRPASATGREKSDEEDDEEDVIERRFKRGRSL